MKFEKGKRYIFSKDKWLTDTGNVLIYKANPWIREQVDKLDGKELDDFNCQYGRVKWMTVSVKHCEEIKPILHEIFSQAVNKVLAGDRERKVIERINMIQDEINDLEMHITVLKSEQNNLFEELKFIQTGRS